MNDVENSQLGKSSVYDSPYNPALLYPLERKENRASLALSAGKQLPFIGEDLWSCYELSWLAPSGKPKAGLAHFRIPCISPRMIESKSFKLYLNSLNQHPIEDLAALHALLVRDLSDAAGAVVSVDLAELPTARCADTDAGAMGECIDGLDVTGFEYQPNPALLRCESESSGLGEVEECLYSDLLRSNCPVTGQPDWGTVIINYRGPKIDRASLLRYVVSFRQCQDFHEHCVERMFLDIMAQCRCQSLSVYARYTRRGGLDINPYRATPDRDASALDIRTVRQ